MNHRNPALIALFALALALVATPAALAGKGNGRGGTGSTISLVPTTTTLAASTSELALGSRVTFDIATGATSEPWVSVACYQGGIAVYGQYWGFWPGYSPSVITNAMAADGVFTLGGTPLWSSGPAACTATLFMVSNNNRQTALATTSFTVAG
jgi:hypothetical protein